MRQFAHKGYRIEQLSRDAKLLYSGFLFFGSVGLLLSVVYYASLVGSAPIEGAKQYYAGELGASASAERAIELDEGGATLDEGTVNVVLAGSAGPTLELPEDELSEAASPMIIPVTTRKLMEVTHFHLFTLPVFLLIIAHVFMLCRMHPRLKTGAVLSGTLSLAAHMAAPWIVFKGGPGWAWVMPVTGTWMLASMLFLIAWPSWAMWRSKPPTGLDRGQEPAVPSS